MYRSAIVPLLAAAVVLSQPAAGQKLGKMTSELFPPACPPGKVAGMDSKGRQICNYPAKPVRKARKALDDRRIGPDKPIGGPLRPISDQIGRK
jgi:hypothetical protein